MAYLIQASSLLITLILSACTSLDEHPLPSSPAQTVELTEDIKRIKNCQKLYPVLGYGSFVDEAYNDIRHQAATRHNANVVLLHSTKEFYQTTRLENYLRTPQMKVPKSTINYYYEDAFTLKSKGTSYLCP